MPNPEDPPPWTRGAADRDRVVGLEAMYEITLEPFQAMHQAAAKVLILQGLAQYWGKLDEAMNPDLNDIGRSYAAGYFVLARVAH